MSEQSVIIVGAGHAGVNLAAYLREDGFDGAIRLIDSGKDQPYQRPPLSKAYLKGEASAQSLILRGPAFYADHRIDLILGDKVLGFDASAQSVRLQSGRRENYTHLVLATGSRPRPAIFSGEELDGVMALRDLADAENLRQRLENARHCVVIGAGFIGLEFAATARAKGAQVDVVEFAPRVLGRAVSSTISEFYAAFHAKIGARLHMPASVAAIEGEAGKVTHVALSDGRRLPADLVVVGIGVLPKERLAARGGLKVANGVVVDDVMTTNIAAISAIGDVAMHPNAFAGRMMRLESVQNALDQARVVSRKIVGKPAPYNAVPWFWSDQGPLKLQIAGLVEGCDRFALRGDPAAEAFSIFCFAQGKLRCVESVNRPADHMIARRLLGLQNPNVSPEQAGDQSFDLKAHSAKAVQISK